MIIHLANSLMVWLSVAIVCPIYVPAFIHPSGEFNEHRKGLFNLGEPRLIFLDSCSILRLLLNDELHRSVHFFVCQFRSLLLWNSTQDDARSLAEPVM